MSPTDFIPRLFSPSRAIIDPREGGTCRRCGRRERVDLGARGLIRGCCCAGISDCCADGYGSVLVTVADVTACALNVCRAMCSSSITNSLKFTQIDDVNGTYRLIKISETATTCSYGGNISPVVKFVYDNNTSDCSLIGGTVFTDALSISVLVSKTTRKIIRTSIISGAASVSLQFLNTCPYAEYDFGSSIPNRFTACDDSCPCDSDINSADPTTNSHSGGTMVVEAQPCCECVWCVSCTEANQVSCPNSECCTPDTIRLTTSSITVALDTCINGTTAKWKLTGTTAANRTIDLLQDATDKCKWQASAASDWVLKKATSYALATITYRATKTSSTNWRMEVFASGGGQTVYFFDGNVTTITGECLAIAAANNSLSCDLCATPKTAGNSGTFTTTGAGSGTSSGNCVVTPLSLSATIASVTTCTDICVCASRYSLTGTTAINRTITLNQTANPSVFEGTVTSADWLLYDFDTAAETHNIDSLRYRLRRVAATTNGWSYDVIGMEGATERLSVVGTDGASCTFTSITSDATANKCADTITAPTHPTRTACIVDATAKGKVGSGGSSTFDVCPI